jgi:hypothetical protein
MVVGADRQKAQLLRYNERHDGPLFKMKNDPRVTRVGRLLRKYSLDEFPQLLNVLQDLFTEEQRLILGIFGSRQRDHAEHLAILEALEKRDEALAVERMRTHLEGVQDAVARWDPEHHPVR